MTTWAGRCASLCRDVGKAFAAGIAQLVFCSGWRAGLLVLAALALVSPWMLVGAAVGGAIGTLLGRWRASGDRYAWRNGMDGFNPAILGIIGAGAFAALSTDLAWVLAAMLAVVAIDQAIRPWAGRVGLYPLSAPAMAVAVILSVVLARDGSWWWPAAEASRGAAALLTAAACIIVAMALEDRRAAGWTAVWSLVGFGLTLVLASSQVGLYVDVWGIVIPLAAFSSFRLFPRDRAVVLSVLAVALAAGLCVVWMQTPLYDVVPPLVVPVVLTLWLLILLQRSPLAVVLNGGLWRLANALGRAQAAGSPVVVALDKRSSPPLYSGDEAIEIAVQDRAVLRWLWQRADERRHESAAIDQAEATRLAAWLDHGVITHLWVADDSGRYDSIDRDLRVDANGRADLARCIGCGDPAPWPPRVLLVHTEIRCARCGGSIVPDLVFPSMRRDLAFVDALNADAECRAAPGVIAYLGEHAEDRRDLARLNDIGAATGIPVFSVPRLVDPENRSGDSRVRQVFAVVLAAAVTIARVTRWSGAGRGAQRTVGDSA
ncbi:MAG: urea transporter [Gammaproteobacteria bacterium]|nr:urea transporter [Gammaproteobacteria bacterium]